MSDDSNKEPAAETAAEMSKLLLSQYDDAQKLIHLKFKDESGNELSLGFPRNVSLSLQMKAYCQNKKADLDTLRLVFHGVPIAPHDTPMSLQMSDGDEIGIYDQASGCGSSEKVEPVRGPTSNLELDTASVVELETTGDQLITITFKRIDETGVERDEVDYPVKRATRIAKLITAYEKAKGFKPGTLMFWYAGKRLKRVDTATSLKMVGRAIVDVRLASSGA